MSSPPTIAAVICDLDGCIGPEAIGPADTPALARIAEHNRLARERGDRPPVTLCTGRPLPYVDAMCRVVDALDLPIICEGGVYLFDPRSYAWETDPRLGPEHAEAARDIRAWVAQTFPGTFFEEGKVASVTIFHREGPEYLEHEVMERVRAKVQAAGLGHRVAMTWTCINVEPAHVDKATGIDRLMARTGLKTPRLAGVGDTMSDLPIRHRVRLFACPANAKPEIRAHADYVSPEPEARGVLDILARIGDGSASGIL